MLILPRPAGAAAGVDEKEAAATAAAAVVLVETEPAELRLLEKEEAAVEGVMLVLPVEARKAEAAGAGETAGEEAEGEPLF